MFQLSACQEMTVVDGNVYSFVNLTYDDLCLLKECDFYCVI